MNDDGKKKCDVSAKAVDEEDRFNKGPVGIPLLIRLLDEIFEKKDNFEAGTLGSTNLEQTLPKKMTLVELFQLYIYKNCSGNAKAILNSLMSDIAKINSDSNNYLQALALETVFDTNICNYFSCYNTRTVEVPQGKLLQFNILKKLDNDLQFTHRTFAEYFVAECISNELRNRQNEPFFKFLCEEILKSDRFKVVRTYLNGFLLIDSSSFPKEALTAMGNTLKHSYYNFILYTSASEGLLELLKFLFKCCLVADITIDMKSLRVGLNHALHQAAQGGHVEVVKFLVEHGTPVDVRNEKDCTALHLAAKTGSLPMVKFLVERGVEMDCKDAEGRTALHEATKNGSFDMVRYLLENGAYINSRDKSGYTALHIAALMGDFDRVKFLVQNGAGIHYRGDRSGTVLSNAVLSGKLEVVKYLVEKGADVMARTKPGGSMLQVLPEWNDNTCMEIVTEMWKFLSEKGVDINTVLHQAINSGYKIDYIKFLVEHGADVKKDSLITEALHVNDVKILKYLMDNGALFNVNHNQNEELYEAIRYNRLEVVKHMGERGIPLDITNESGDPALNAAIGNNDHDMIKVLVQNNVKIDGPDVLTLALKKCNLETVKFLVESGANAKLDFGEVISKDLETVKFLMEKGAKFRKFYAVGDNLELLKFLFDNDVEVDKTNIFSKAAENGNLGIVKFLLEKGVDVNATNEEENAALHLAIKRNHIPIFKCLLGAGADIEIKNRDDHTPLYVATSHGCLETVKILIDRGADVQNVTIGALREAMQGGYVEIVKYLVEKGVPINVTSDYFGTPLSVALNFGLLELAEFLPERDSNYMCKLEEVVRRLIVDIDDAESEEDNEILLVIFDSVKTVTYLIEKGVDFNPRVINKFKFFISAVSESDFKLVKYLIEKGCDVNIKGDWGYTALHKTTDLNMAKLLIRNGGNVNAKNEEGKSVLHSAIEKSNLDMCKLLIENGADVNDEDTTGRTLLHMTRFQWGSISIDKIKYLIKIGAKLKLTKDGRNVLQDAVATSHIDLDLVKYLLSLGQDVNCRDKDGGMPLDDAIVQGDLDVVRLLVENGAEVDQDTTTKSGVLFNAITIHCRGGWDCSLDMVKYLVSKGANVHAENKNPLLFDAISNSNFENVKFLIESGADVNVTTEDGYSLLHQASQSNNLSLAKYLIDKGAPLDTETPTGRTVLHEAASRGSYATVKFFLENGANANVRDKDGRTPLHETAASRQSYFGLSEAFNVAKLLIEKGAEVNAKTRKGLTPLHEAVSHGQVNKVQLLIGNGADVNAKDEYGRTPLFIVVMAGKKRKRIFSRDDKGVVRFLVNSGANINEKDNDGRTVLHEAAILGKLKMMMLLVELGADVNSRSLNDCTPLHDAARKGILEGVEFLVQKGADIHAESKHGETALEAANKATQNEIVDFLAKRMEGAN